MKEGEKALIPILLPQNLLEPMGTDMGLSRRQISKAIKRFADEALQICELDSRKSLQAPIFISSSMQEFLRSVPSSATLAEAESKPGYLQDMISLRRRSQ